MGQVLHGSATTSFGSILGTSLPPTTTRVASRRCAASRPTKQSAGHGQMSRGASPQTRTINLRDQIPKGCIVLPAGKALSECGAPTLSPCKAYISSVPRQRIELRRLEGPIP